MALAAHGPTGTTQSLPSSSFSRALNRFTSSLTDKQRLEFKFCTLSDVYIAITAIQDERGSKNAMRNMARIQGFLEGMDDYRKMVEAFLNCTPFMGYVWGPIRFILIATNTWVTSLDIILNAYKEIHERLPSFVRYQVLFDENPEMRRALELYFCDILEFHRNAMEFLNRPGWKKLFTAFWKTFETRFSCILDSLARHKDLIESEKTTVALVEAQRTREIAESHYEAMQDIERKKQISITQSGEWIFQNELFRDWADPHSGNNPLIYINGIPGAGKTTLASHIIEVLLENKTSFTLFFYCKHAVSSKNTLKGILRALLAQIACKDNVAASYLYEFCCTRDQSNVFAKLEELAEMIFDSQKLTFIVIDGLDECEPEEAGKILSWFISRQGDLTSTEHGHLKLMCIGQRTDALVRLLCKAPQICLEIPEHRNDVRRFIEQQANVIRHEFDIGADVEFVIIRRVSIAAQGMFLFAKLVLENLLGQTSQYDLLRELEPDIFPVDLKNAYERIVANVYAKGPQRAAAVRLIEWVACAKRPLTWGEVQATFFVDPQKATADFEGRKLRKRCKTLCASLIDVSKDDNKPEAEAILTLVHDTARTYLQQNDFLDLPAQKVNAALYCIEYLLSRPFCLMATEKELEECSQRGYYTFLDYAASYWLEHVIEAFELTISDGALANSYDRLATEIRCFLQDTHVVDQQKLDSLEGQDHPRLLEILLGLPCDTAARNQWMQLEMRFLRIMTMLETISENLGNDPVSSLRDPILAMYGTIRYRCPKLGCGCFTVGFMSRSERDSHLNEHRRPFFCPKPHCPSRTLGFSDEKGLKTHLIRSHEHERDTGRFIFPSTTRRKQLDIFSASKAGNIDTVQLLISDAKRQDALNAEILSSYSVGRPPSSIDGLVVSSTTAEEEEKYTIKCFCNLQVDDGNTILCDRCETWQHVECYHFQDFQDGYPPNINKIVHNCIDCEPRPYDEKGAVDRQKDRFYPKERWIKNAITTTLKRRPKISEPNAGFTNGYVHDDNESPHYDRIELTRCAVDDIVNAPMKADRAVRGIEVGTTPLKLAASYGHLNICRLLVAEGTQMLYSALESAVVRDDVEMIQFFLTLDRVFHGSPMPRGTSLLHIAVTNRSKAAVEFLLNRSDHELYVLDVNGESAIHYAAKTDSAEILGVLLASGKINPDLGNLRGATPLILASLLESSVSVGMLLCTGDVNPNATDEGGQTPLMNAMKTISLATLKLLLEHPYTDLNFRTKWGINPLTSAITSWQNEIVTLLLATGRVDVKSDGIHKSSLLKINLSPLCLAASEGNKSVVKMLLKTGKFDPNERMDSEDMRSALRHTNSKAIVELLQAAELPSYGVENPPVISFGPPLRLCEMQLMLLEKQNKSRLLMERQNMGRWLKAQQGQDPVKFAPK